MFYGGKELKWIWLNMWPNADPLGRTRERKRYTIYICGKTTLINLSNMDAKKFFLFHK